VKFLFVHQNFPGQYLHIVRHLLATQRHEVVFLSGKRQPTAAYLIGHCLGIVAAA